MGTSTNRAWALWLGAQLGGDIETHFIQQAGYNRRSEKSWGQPLE